MKQLPKPPYQRTILVCCRAREEGRDACANRGSEQLLEPLKSYVKEHGLKKRVRISRSLCFDLCARGPVVCVQPDNVWLTNVGPQDIPAIIDQWIRPHE
ncbi:MAG: (2Fe-2S) ferredoxin domain-containing protein [Candidatus Eisenbacteria bacterium]|nr:(2Fe-2S) ferredoxin domain-containing protein [Candidatus Eisenbacteria bacterium]